jgi:Domain of unknown function (DUF5069)
VNRPAAAKDLNAETLRGLDAELEGYAWIPRMLDKARATLAGTAGDYPFGCPVDHTCMARLGITPELVLDLAARHTDDHAVLDALRAHGIPQQPKRGSTARRSRTSCRTPGTTCACAPATRCRRPKAAACSLAPSTAPS